MAIQLDRAFGVRFTLSILFCFFGVGSWVAINGLWSEIPIIVPQTPECWTLLSYLSVIIQLANIGPIAFTVSNSLWQKKSLEIYVIPVILVVGTVACILLTQFWQYTTVIAGDLHSTSLFILTFFLALVDCTSSVTFFPFLANFPSYYITPFFIGEGLSGFIPSIIALIQGTTTDETCWSPPLNITTWNLSETSALSSSAAQTSGEPLFEVHIFFYVLFAMMSLSLLSYVLLNVLPMSKAEQMKAGKLSGLQSVLPTSPPPEIEDPKVSSFQTSSSSSGSSGSEQAPMISLSNSPVDLQALQIAMFHPTLATKKFVMVMLLLTTMCAFSNGIIPSIQTYMAIPYGNIAFHLVVNLGNITNPLACFASFWITTKKVWVIVVLSCVGIGLSVFLFTIATLASPPLAGSTAGVVMIVGSAVCSVAVVSYTKVLIGSMCRDSGRRALLWCGVFTQLGSFCGALTVFVLINFTTLF